MKSMKKSEPIFSLASHSDILVIEDRVKSNFRMTKIKVRASLRTRILHATATNIILVI